MKLQPGDYVSTEGMTEEEYHAVCRAFIEAGAEKYNDPWPYNEFDSMGWDADSVYIISCGYGSVRANRCFNRELTKDQILGAQKMTKVTVFGQEEAKKEEKKAIEFVKSVGGDGCYDAFRSPASYYEVMLMQKDYHLGFDLIIGIEDSGFKCAFLGHWNDGVV